MLQWQIAVLLHPAQNIVAIELDQREFDISRLLARAEYPAQFVRFELARGLRGTRLVLIGLTHLLEWRRWRSLDERSSPSNHRIADGDLVLDQSIDALPEISQGKGLAAISGLAPIPILNTPGSHFNEQEFRCRRCRCFRRSRRRDILRDQLDRSRDPQPFKPLLSHFRPPPVRSLPTRST